MPTIIGVHHKVENSWKAKVRDNDDDCWVMIGQMMMEGYTKITVLPDPERSVVVLIAEK